MEQTRTVRGGTVGGQPARTWIDAVAEALRDNHIEAIAHVPDEVTGHLLARLEADPACTVIACTREEEGVAVLSGAYLGGKRGALILQASGVGNSLNALGSLAVGYRIPMLLLISERGGLGEFNPVQVPLGRVVPSVLDAVGIQTFALTSTDTIGPVLGGAAELSFSTGMPVAVVLSTVLTGGKTLK